MPANPMRGEADLGEHKLIVDFNRWCVLEAATGKTVPELLATMRTGFRFAFKDMRAYVRAFLDADMTEEEVGDLISSCGMVEVPTPNWKKGLPKTQRVWAASVQLGKAIDGFFPPVEEAPANPLKAA